MQITCTSLYVIKIKTNSSKVTVRLQHLHNIINTKPKNNRFKLPKEASLGSYDCLFPLGWSYSYPVYWGRLVYVGDMDLSMYHPFGTMWPENILIFFADLLVFSMQLFKRLPLWLLSEVDLYSQKASKSSRFPNWITSCLPLQRYELLWLWLFCSNVFMWFMKLFICFRTGFWITTMIF